MCIMGICTMRYALQTQSDESIELALRCLSASLQTLWLTFRLCRDITAWLLYHRTKYLTKLKESTTTPYPLSKALNVIHMQKRDESLILKFGSQNVNIKRVVMQEWVSWLVVRTKQTLIKRRKSSFDADFTITLDANLPLSNDFYCVFRV